MKADIKKLMPGYKVNEYLLVLTPHRELWDKIMKVKEKLYRDYIPGSTGFGKPHIPLANFIQYAMLEERIINRLQSVAMAHYPFKAALKDFGSFPSHTIYINVLSKVPVQSLVKMIRTEVHRLMKLNDDNKPHFFTEPHITIAGRLQPRQYEQSWLEYSHQNFSGRFIADSMLLLKRPVGEHTYQKVKRFEFQNLPVLTKQGELFG